jgi:hypothetical protein
MKKKKFAMIGILIIVLLSLNFVNADFWSCFSRGQTINFCNPSIPDRTCGTTLCKFCMSNYDSVNKCYSPGAFNVCNAGSSACNINFGGEVDGEAPNITLIEPTEGTLYTDRKVYLNIEVNEKSSLYYLDNLNGRGRWVRLCTNCYDYGRARSFKEGENWITIKAVDNNGNEKLQDVQFSIDSKSPRIHRYEPRRGFASGEFRVQYSEDNVEEIKLIYGNYDSGMKEVSLENCEDGNRKECFANVDLSSYDGEQIEYWFEVEDKAGNKVSSRTTNLDVDISFPIINNLEVDVERNKATFIVEIDEQNLDKVYYINYGDSRPKERVMCSRLRDGICEKRISLRSGTHNIDIQVVDKAGNSVSQNVVVEID